MLPLDGVRILSFEQFGAAPFGTLFLANLGAEVIKVENPAHKGDVSRSIGPYFLNGDDPSNNSLYFQSVNHNKSSLTLDLSKDGAQTVLHDLLRTCDALATNLRGDVAGKLGLTYRELGKFNPKLVCAHITAYGRSGPRSSWPGYDYIMQAEAGYFHLTGDPDSPPTRFGLSIVDYMTGMGLALALTSALIGARQTGKGRDIDVNLFDMALYNLGYVALWQMNAGHNQQRVPRSAHPSVTPCQLFKTRDGWIYINCSKEKFWQILCDKVGKPEWKSDPRFLTFKDRFENRQLLNDLLEDVTQQRNTDDWIQAFEARIPFAPILDVESALTNPFVANSDRITTIKHSDDEVFKALRCPIRFEGEQTELQTAPALGQHTDDLLRELAGYDDSRIENLRQRKVI
ncbi:MAG: CoA transferase [Gammaproteobacteria bacterium]|nr:CoA transferase [Gammaproteobacteria bacterium]